MSVRAFNMTMNGAVQDSIFSTLAAVAGSGLNPQVGGPDDRAYRTIIFQAAKANTNDVNITQTGKTFSAIRLDPGDTSANSWLPLMAGIGCAMRLSEFAVQGSNGEVLQILAIE